jgi:hypothetical protein
MLLYLECDNITPENYRTELMIPSMKSYSSSDFLLK